MSPTSMIALSGGPSHRRATRLVLAGVVMGAACSAPTSGTYLGTSSSPTPTFQHYGFAAGPMLFTDSTGHLVEVRRQEPFSVPIDARIHDGNAIVAGPPDLVHRDLNALNKRTDVATGWSDHGARWMAPETGRWLGPDPAVSGPDARLMRSPWALHPYQYADENPIAFWDPDGREPIDVPSELQLRPDVNSSPAPSSPTIHGRAPTDAGGNATGPYGHVTTFDHGITAGLGLVNGAIGPGVSAQIGVDAAAGEWVDGNGAKTYGVSAQANLAKVNIAQGTVFGPIGTDFGIGNAELVCSLNENGITVGVEANLIDGAVTVGDARTYVRVGAAVGILAEYRLHATDGVPSGVGVDVGLLEFDANIDPKIVKAGAKIISDTILDAGGLSPDKAVEGPQRASPARSLFDLFQ